jgi:hypothetical protein
MRSQNSGYWWGLKIFKISILKRRNRANIDFPWKFDSKTFVAVFYASNFGNFWSTISHNVKFVMNIVCTPEELWSFLLPLSKIWCAYVYVKYHIQCVERQLQTAWSALASAFPLPSPSWIHISVIHTAMIECPCTKKIHVNLYCRSLLNCQNTSQMKKIK